MPKTFNIAAATPSDSLLIIYRRLLIRMPSYFDFGRASRRNTIAHSMISISFSRSMSTWVPREGLSFRYRQRFSERILSDCSFGCRPDARSRRQHIREDIHYYGFDAPPRPQFVVPLVLTRVPENVEAQVFRRHVTIRPCARSP